MAIRVKDYELFELAYNSNVANPEKLTYVNSRGDEFTVLSESCQTDESWIEYVDEYHNIIADNTEHHRDHKNNSLEYSKNNKNDKKSTKLPRIQSATSRFANPTANRPQTFYNENSRKKLESLHLKSRRKIVSLDDVGSPSDGSDEFGSTDRSVRFQGFSEGSDENEDKLTELSKKVESDMDFNRRVGARSALDVAISQHCLTNTAAMVQSKIYGNINPGYMDHLALSSLSRNSTRHTLNKEEIRPLLDDYVTTSYRYSDTQGPIHIKRSTVNRASIIVAEECAKKRLECEKLNHEKRTAELALKKLKMQQKQKQLNTLKSYGSKFNKAYSPEEKSNWNKLQNDQTARRTTARFSVVTKSTVKKQDRDYEEMIDNSNSDDGDRFGGKRNGQYSVMHKEGRRDSFDTVSAAIQTNDKGQDTIKFSLNTAACRKWVNVPKDQGLIFEAKQQLEGVPDDLSSIPLNLMMAEMAGKLEELISDTQKKARRIVKNKDQIGKDGEGTSSSDTKYKIKKSTNFNCYNNSSNAASHQVRESASKTSQSGHDQFSSNANLFKNPVLRDVLEWRGVGRTSVVTLEGGDSVTSMNQLSMGGIVGAKRKVRTAILQRFVKMNIKAVKENYKKPNGMDLFHVTTYVTDQWSNKNFTKVYYYPKTKTEREYSEENSRPAIILFSNQKQHLQPCVIVNVFDEKTGKIFATGNNTHCIWIDGWGFFDCSTHLLTLFSTDRKSSFYQEKFKIKINENISLKYDGKKKRVSFCFEYTKLGMPSVDLDLPLGDRDGAMGVAGNSKNISLIDSRRTRRTGYKNVIAVYLVQQRSKINKLLKEMNNARQGMSMVSGKARSGGKIESGKMETNNSRLEKACKVKKTKSDAKIQEKLQVAMQRNANANLSYFLPILKIHSEPKTPKKVIKIDF